MSDTTLPLVSAPRAASWGARLSSGISAQSIVLMGASMAWLVATGGSLLGDPDTQWHIAVGHDIWTNRSVPTKDLYSHTFQGAPWMAKEWLSQLILFAAHALGGWRGTVLVTALAISAAYAGLYEWLRRRVQPTLALAMVLAAMLLGYPHFLARPHMLILPVVAAWMIALAVAIERRGVPPLAAAGLMTLWANMHGSFPLGLVMGGILALEGIVAAAPAERRKTFLRWTLFLGLATLATTLSPYGWRAILVPLRMEGNSETLRFVNEWQPLHADFIGGLALACLALALLALAPRWRANLVRIVAVALLGLMMVRHVRFVSVFGLMAPILVAQAVARFPVFAPRRAEPAPAILWCVASALGASILFAVAYVSPVPARTVTPDAAYRAAVAAGVGGPVYNDYDFGGYLISKGVKTFIDGRTDQLFLGDFLPALSRSLDDPNDAAFSALLAKHHVTWAIVRTKGREARHLARMLLWTRVYTDDVATVFKAKP